MRSEGFILPIRKAIGLCLASVLLGVVLGACQADGRDSDHKTSPQQSSVLDKYIIANSELGDLVDIIPARGVFVSSQHVVVGSEVSGKIIKVYVKPDEKVKKGQILAEFDPEPFEAAYRQNLSDIKISEANIRALQAELSKTEKQLERRSKIKDYLDEPLETIDNLKYDAMALKARIDGAKSRLEKDKANLRIRKFNLERTKIYAPIEGIVLERKIEEGANVNANFKTPELFVITSDRKNMLVEALISELDIARIEPGQTVNIHPAALPNTTLIGKVQSIETSPVKQGNFVSYKVMFDFLGVPVSPKIKPGMSASIEVYGQDLHDAAILPIGALYTFPRGDWEPDIKALGLSLDETPELKKMKEAERTAWLVGRTIGYFAVRNQRMVFIIEDGKIKVHGIHVLGEGKDIIAYDEKDLPIGTPVIVGKKADK